MNTIKAMIYAAESKMNNWKKAVNDSELLLASGKSLEEAQNLVHYFEGKYDAMLEVVKICKCDK
jgi:hypothetical protein